MGLKHTMQAIERHLDGLTVGNEQATIHNFDNLPNSINTADAPYRLLQPFEDANTSAAELSRLTHGSAPLLQVTRQISDLMLHEPVNQDEFTSVTAELVDYNDAYEDRLLHAYYELAEDGYMVTSFTSSLGIFEYPPASGQWWRGVEVVLSIQSVEKA